MTEREAIVALSLLLSGCGEAYNREFEQRKAQREYEDSYQQCVNRHVGAFSTATPEIVAMCHTSARKGQTTPYWSGDHLPERTSND
jgi:hypothetical protein